MVQLLIIKDDSSMLEMLVEMFSRQGYEVVGHANPKEAVELMAQRRFDVILTDFYMEPLDGIGILRSAKKVCPDAKVILFSGCLFEVKEKEYKGQDWVTTIREPDFGPLFEAVKKATTLKR